MWSTRVAHRDVWAGRGAEEERHENVRIIGRAFCRRPYVNAHALHVRVSDAVMPIMSVYRLPQGQYGYSGHVVNLPQDVASFVQSLPRLPSELDVIVVRKEGPTRAIRTSVSDVQWCTELSSGWSHTTSTTTLSQITCINPVPL